MRVVVLCSSPYSETGCAMAARLAQMGHRLAGALTLPTLDRGTLLRKVAQWGFRESAEYAWAKLTVPTKTASSSVRNPYLEAVLRKDGSFLRNLDQVGHAYRFPVFRCADQNSTSALVQLKSWQPDVAVFTGGNILRQQAVEIPRFGIVNSHLAQLPQIRGMSSPEWSLLRGVPLGVTIHRMDSGIDTGPILLQRSFPDALKASSLTDLRNRMIAFGIELVGEALSGLEDGTLSPRPQSDLDRDNQFFVMHDWLKTQALRSLQRDRVLAGEAGE